MIVTSVKRLGSTCKRWNAIFEDERFIEKHFSKAPKESMVLILKGYRVCPVSVNLNVAPPSIEFKGALGLKISPSSSEEVDIVNVFHCDGLLLCNTKDGRLVAWNPCLGETRWIQRKTCYDIESRFTLGYIQNKKSCRSYKILRRWGVFSDPKFDIYEFSSDSWRVLNDVVLDRIIPRDLNINVFRCFKILVLLFYQLLEKNSSHFYIRALIIDQRWRYG
ncbi:PREDICTED: F-box protein At3g22350-like [Camelina sativa]|uniref:F-box protein At3g22350-like n=1 Tax=Camelina sativa TaxID=90675 RepID=A0ABM1Q9N7_CAMSA|nr:PREDICTED: F-box protein At3g22350-like [Camelina sativa]